MKKLIEVVAAIIIKDEKIFCVQRGMNKALSGKWEFPGGKIELDETHEKALVREIQEELSSRIKVYKHYISTKHEYEEFKIVLHAYICELIEGDLTLSEHINKKWLNCNDLNDLDWAEADKPIVNKLKGENYENWKNCFRK